MVHDKDRIWDTVYATSFAAMMASNVTKDPFAAVPSSTAASRAARHADAAVKHLAEIEAGPGVVNGDTMVVRRSNPASE